MSLLSNLKHYKLLFILWISICIQNCFPLNLMAQDESSFQWRKSAKSLTTFKPGDAVQITIWDLHKRGNQDNYLYTLDFSGDYPINPDGNIIVPVVGEIKVRGLTIYELTQKLTEEYKAYLYEPYINIRPLIRLTVLGAFNKTGSYLIDPASSLWDLVAMAGGPDRTCDLTRMWIERGGEVVLENLIENYEKGHSLEEIGVISGDQLMAHHRRGLNLQLALMIFNLMSTLALLYLRFRGIG